MAAEAGSTQVSMGCSHALYLHPDGTVWASGGNSWGQLGNGNTTDSTAPVQVTGLTNVTQVAAGCYVSVALRADGTVWVWGQNQGLPTANPPDGSCPGFGGTTTVPCFLHPTHWQGPTDVKKVVAGLSVGALQADGTAYIRGQQIASSSPVTDIAIESYSASSPAYVVIHGQVYEAGGGAVAGIDGTVVSIGAGGFTGYAVTSDGATWAWGDDRYGQLGDQGSTAQASAIKVPGLPPTVAVVGGLFHAVALDTAGNAWTWGDNTDGQAGPQQPSAVDAAPSQIPGLGSVSQVSAGGYSTLVLTAPRQSPTRLTAAPALVKKSPLAINQFDLKATLVTTRPVTKALAGQTVRFTAKGKLLCVATTTSNGVADCNVGVSQPALQILLQNGYTAVFPGTADYAGSSATGKLIG
ncbi:MAG TPA: hypothetical protein VG650_10440 [Mycobacteriales bacterium]|nr:hypothetical protein [Mycobacteriales bacterium]